MRKKKIRRNWPYAKEMNKHYMNLGQYNNRHVIKHVNLKIKNNVYTERTVRVYATIPV